MPSKRSFFNRTLFRKDLTRFWPLWVGLSAAGSLLPLYILLALFSGAARHLDALDFAQALYMAAAAGGPALSMGYAALCAMLVWGYLYNARSVGLMHTLPVDRTCLFVTTTLAGLAMMLIPYVIVGGLSCLIAVFWGFFDVIAAVNTALAILLMTLAFFGLATFCAMLTGSVFALPALYLLANFLAPLLEALLTGLAGAFLIGSPGGEGRLTFLSPVMQMYTSLSVEGIRGTDGNVADYVLNGFGTLGLYGLAGLVLLVLAWALYRKRHSECAGDIAAFRWLRPIFRYGLALLCALTLGWMLYELLWAALFQPGIYAQAVPMAVCMALTGALGYYAASMLLEKSLRVFKGSWKGLLAVCLGAAALCAGVRLDVFGAERRVPEASEVASVELRGYDTGLEYSMDTEPELAERVLEVHRAIVADRAYLRSLRDEDITGVYRYFTLTYRMKDGSALTRAYHLCFTEERMADPETYDGKLGALLNDPEAIVHAIAVPAGGEVTDMYFFNYETGYGVDGLERADCQRLYEAVLQDAREGNVPGPDLLEWQTAHYDFYLEIEYREAAGSPLRGYKTVYLYPSMAHTIDALTELGYLSGEALEKWDAQLSLNEG